MIKQALIQTIVFALIACSNIKQDNLTTDIVLESRFEQLTQQAIRDSAVIFRLDTLTNISWDTLVIIRPYFPIDSIARALELNFHPVLHNNSALINDGVNVLVFIKKRKIVNYVLLPRDKGDFYSTEGNVILKKEHCFFELVRTEKKFTNGQNVVEVNMIY